MQVVMSAAGRGTRFQEDYNIPKPFILVDGKPMWQRAIEPWLKYGKPTIVMHSSHKPYLNNKEVDANWIFIDEYTEGAAITASIGVRNLNKEKPVVFVECDSIIHFNHDQWSWETSGTFVAERNNPAHSYCKVSEDMSVTEIREKEVISNWANTGHYWFKSVKEFLDIQEKAVKEKRKVRGEYYIAPLLNDRIQEGAQVFAQKVDKWHCWGTPEDVKMYKNG